MSDEFTRKDFEDAPMARVGPLKIGLGSRRDYGREDGGNLFVEIDLNDVEPDEDGFILLMPPIPKEDLLQFLEDMYAFEEGLDEE